MNRNYLLLPATQGHENVELWSTTRPPFEPKGWLKEMRDDVASAVCQLQPSGRDLLSATYVSSIAGLCDVENVLFYNIGPGSFRLAMSNGVRFERAFSRPPAPPLPIDATPHYQSYAMRGIDDGFAHWAVGPAAATWERIEVPPLISSTKVSAIWCAIRSAAISVRAERPLPGHFGLRVMVDVPNAAVAATVSSFLKPLLDGLISAFHSHDGSDLAEVRRRLALQTGASEGQMTKFLDGATTAVLGERQLVRRFISGVQWNPRDDDCVAAEVIVHTVAGRDWSMSGALFDVAAV